MLAEQTITSFCQGEITLDHFLPLDTALFSDEKVTQPLCAHWHVPSSMRLKQVKRANELSTACVAHTHLEALKKSCIKSCGKICYKICAQD